MPRTSARNCDRVCGRYRLTAASLEAAWLLLTSLGDVPHRRKPTEKDDSSEPTGRQGLPPLTVDSPRISFLLRGDEIEALRAFAQAHRWPLSTAVRALLREQLMDEELPF
jgi:hypothetical protein